MEFWHILLLALVQALTEFLPVSSSGHLVLASQLFGWDYQGLAFDLALHFGTLLAILVYFRQDVWELIVETLRWRPGKPMNESQRLAFGIALATVPAGLAGLALGDAGAMVLRHPLMIAANLVVFGALLWFADLHSRKHAATVEKASASAAKFSEIGFGKALLIGCAQALALMPGTSRSGATMTAGLLLGLDRTRAARYSFLLSIPVMVLATAHAAWEMRDATATPLAWSDFFLGAAISAIAGWLVIRFFLETIRRVGVAPFAIYRFVLAAVVVAWWFLRQ